MIGRRPRHQGRKWQGSCQASQGRGRPHQGPRTRKNSKSKSPRSSSPLTNMAVGLQVCSLLNLASHPISLFLFVLSLLQSVILISPSSSNWCPGTQQGTDSLQGKYSFASQDTHCSFSGEDICVSLFDIPGDLSTAKLIEELPHVVKEDTKLTDKTGITSIDWDVSSPHIDYQQSKLVTSSVDSNVRLWDETGAL